MCRLGKLICYGALVAVFLTVFTESASAGGRRGRWWCGQCCPPPVVNCAVPCQAAVPVEPYAPPALAHEVAPPATVAVNSRVQYQSAYQASAAPSGVSVAPVAAAPVAVAPAATVPVPNYYAPVPSRGVYFESRNPSYGQPHTVNPPLDAGRKIRGL